MTEIKFKKNYSLVNHNTYKLNIKTKLFYLVNTYDDILNLITSNILKKEKIFILGSGSNTLFTKNFDGLIIHPRIKGIKIENIENNYVFLNVACGEIWDDVVKYAVDNNYYGIENLSYIPGQAGSAPVQNIGAYGSELKDIFFKLDAIDLYTGEIKTFYLDECNFSYRYSIFKEPEYKKYLITSITIKLSLTESYNLSYNRLQNAIKNQKDINLNLIRKTIFNLRNEILPDYNKLGNVGSFFKNPIVNINTYISIKQKYPLIPAFPIDDNHVKLSAAWLIENAGLKGYKINNVGIYHKQALVIVNYGNAKPSYYSHS